MDTLGWNKAADGTTSLHAHRTEDEETNNGPADYGLWLSKDLVRIVEPKEDHGWPANMLTQAERYSRGARRTKVDFAGYRVPFIYSTNGEVFSFRDARHPLKQFAPVSRLPYCQCVLLGRAGVLPPAPATFRA